MRINKHMEWNGEKIRGLRLRMGWSQSDLARRLHIESQKVGQLEMGLEEAPEEVTQVLDLLFKQAEDRADTIFCGTLAEIVFEEDEVLQVDRSSVRRKFLDQ